MNPYLIFFLLLSISPSICVYLRDLGDRNLLYEYYKNEAKIILYECKKNAARDTSIVAAILSSGLSIPITAVKIYIATTKRRKCKESRDSYLHEISRRRLRIDERIIDKMQTEFKYDVYGIQILTAGVGMVLGNVLENLIGPSIDSCLDEIVPSGIRKVASGMKVIKSDFKLGGEIAGSLPEIPIGGGEQMVISGMQRKVVGNVIEGPFTYAAFYQACRRGDLQTLKNCIKYGKINVEKRDEEGFNGLHYACRDRDNVEVVKYLVGEANANIHSPIHGDVLEGVTPVYLAARNANMKILAYLVEKGADVNIVRKDKRTPLFRAVEEGHYEVVKFLVQKAKAKNHFRDRYGNTALHIAAAKGLLKIVKVIAEGESTNVNCKNHQQRTPYDEAILNENHEVVNYLRPLTTLSNHPALQKTLSTPKLNYKEPSNFQSGRVMRFAPVQNPEAYLKTLKMSESKPEIISGEYFQACRNGDLQTLKDCIKYGKINVENRDEEGFNGLHYACRDNDNVEVVKYLVGEANANIHSPIHGDVLEGVTPVYLAARNANMKILAYLVEKGADVNIVRKDKQTPLFRAVEEGHYEVVKFLVQKAKAKNHFQDRYGNTALHIAAAKGLLKIVKVIAEGESTDVNCKNHQQRTPYDEAILNDNHEIANYLQPRTKDFNVDEGEEGSIIPIDKGSVMPYLKTSLLVTIIALVIMNRHFFMGDI